MYYTNAYRSNAEMFAIGDLVWISTKNLRTACPVKRSLCPPVD